MAIQELGRNITDSLAEFPSFFLLINHDSVNILQFLCTEGLNEDQPKIGSVFKVDPCLWILGFGVV